MLKYPLNCEFKGKRDLKYVIANSRWLFSFLIILGRYQRDDKTPHEYTRGNVLFLYTFKIRVAEVKYSSVGAVVVSNIRWVYAQNTETTTHGSYGYVLCNQI